MSNVTAAQRFTQKALPKNEKDGRLSRTHLQDSVAFNMSHAKDHLEAAKDAKKRLKEGYKLAKKGY